MNNSSGHSPKLFLESETFEIIGVCMAVHKELGHGFLEIVYKDAIELELKAKAIPYSREQAFIINYKGTVLPHRYFADFVVGDQIILEVKAQEGGLSYQQVPQLINYLRASGHKVGLLVNFGRTKLDFKRLVF